MFPPFRFSMPVVLSPDAADHLLQILADIGHLLPVLHDLYQHLTNQAHSQGDVTHQRSQQNVVSNNCVYLLPGYVCITYVT